MHLTDLTFTPGWMNYFVTLLTFDNLIPYQLDMEIQQRLEEDLLIHEMTFSLLDILQCLLASE